MKNIKTYEGFFDRFRKKSEDDKLALDFMKRLQRIKGLSPYKIEKGLEGTEEGESYFTRYKIFFDDTIIKITKAVVDKKYKSGWHEETQEAWIKDGAIKKNNHTFFGIIAAYVGEHIVCSPSIAEDFFDLAEEVYNRNIKLSRVKKIRDEMNPAADKLDPEIWGEPEEDQFNESVDVNILEDFFLDLEDKEWLLVYSEKARFHSLLSEDESTQSKKLLARDRTDRDGLPWSELKYIIMGARDFLGDDFISFKYRNKKDSDSGRVIYHNIDLNENTEIEGLIWAFTIEFKI